MEFNFPVLVGDIGGTNARFAIVRDGNSPVLPFDPVRISAFETIEDAIQASVLDKTSLALSTVMLAIATPLVGESFHLTNGDWVITPGKMITRFGLDKLYLMNDFAAQGLAAIALAEQHLHFVGRGRIADRQPKVVIGPGTGLGIANLVHVNGKWAILSGEGGHVDLGPRTDTEIEIWRHLKRQNGRVSAEWAISGQGLENLYQAICKANGSDRPDKEAAEISAAALDGSDPNAREAIDLFLVLLARISGDMALITLANGGVYIAGGIPAKILPAIDAGRFRAEFENKAPHSHILKEIAVCIMTHPNAALEGLVACVASPQRFFLEGFTKSFSIAG